MHIKLHCTPILTGTELKFNENGYLFYGRIERERVLAVFPLGGQLITIPVYPGELMVPQAFINLVGSPDKQGVKAAVINETCPGCGSCDPFRC